MTEPALPARLAPLSADWSIGIYRGESPLALRPAAGNPMLRARDVTDVAAGFVADPFLLRDGGTWYLFFEVLESATKLGRIGLAESSDGLRWRYRQTVLAEPFHLSYPYVFAWEGQCFMIPETLDAGCIRLYRADPFPTRWRLAAELHAGRFADPSIALFEGRWWLFACPRPHAHDTLCLYSAPAPAGPWREHPQSPLVTGDRRRARPAGRVLSHGGRLIRYAQDCHPFYGTAVRAFVVQELTATAYREEEAAGSPVLAATGSGWNGKGMHHVDPHPLPDGDGWIACVDGRSRS